MSRDWKPGDVLAGLLDGNEIVGIVRGSGKRMFYADSVTSDQVDLKHVTNLRPLVVIDPEDEAQLERLGKAMRGSGCRWSTDIQAALRSLVTPPKPDEPTDLAVRVAADGLIWARVADVWVSNTDHPREWRWLAEQDDFKILSDGVQP